MQIEMSFFVLEILLFCFGKVLETFLKKIVQNVILHRGIKTGGKEEQAPTFHTVECFVTYAYFQP